MTTLQDIQKTAERMRGTLRDVLDQPNHAQAKSVQQQLERLISDIRGGKSRDALDNNVKQLIRLLEDVEESVMDHRHSDALIGTCEDLRSDISHL